ncbi:MAG: metal ABC transporter solute-binding protein, Zn/Mn family [Phototrophicaceae bacterium]|jgi:manganese/zinc/iron transport system substrate-binding protein
MKHKHIVLIILTLALSVTAAGFAQQDTLKIVATTTQANDLATILTDGVDGIEIFALMGAGVDPHLYQPTEADIVAMNSAELVIYSGLHLEGQFDAVFEALSEQGISIFALGQPVKDAGYIIGGFTLSAELVNVDDPHFWFDPRNWELTTLALAEELSQLDPANADLYAANAEAYLTDLQAIYAWADAGMRPVPEGQRYIVTSHDAFQYFGAAFGWQMFAVQGISTQDEAGVGDIQAVVNFVLDNDIPVIFVESSLPPDTVEAVAAAVKDAGGELRVGVRQLYSDAMGVPGTFGGTYIGMIAENVYTLLQSYQCAGVEVTIPEWPQDLEPVPPAELLNVDCDT